ncbi:MAG: YggS family pyridoxal phosphate-dependent enzyme [Nanoarchaeota archaeon]|nr:YggS family pyridoxal phosphate-dependent enzyme [Nanoarchaeota archaeon]
MIEQEIQQIKGQLKGVTLVVATKGRTVEEINKTISAGITIIGENYVKEAAEKHHHLAGKVAFHLLGHLQRNKVSTAVKIFDLIQTADSLPLAQKINEECKKINKNMPVLIEVNIAKEKNKTGCAPEEVEKLAANISRLTNLRLKGLMTMGPALADAEELRPYFKEMKIIFDKLQKEYNLSMLSMGMSESYRIALEEGATRVRIGKKIFA